MLDLAHDLEDRAPYEDEDGDGFKEERPKLNRKIRLTDDDTNDDDDTVDEMVDTNF